MRYTRRMFFRDLRTLDACEDGLSWLRTAGAGLSPRKAFFASFTSGFGYGRWIRRQVDYYAPQWYGRGVDPQINAAKRIARYVLR